MINRVSRFPLGTLLFSVVLLGCGGTTASVGDGGTRTEGEGTAAVGEDGGMVVPSQGHTATLLANGKVLVTGGGNVHWAPTNAAGLFDPATNTWSPTARLNVERINHSSTLLADGRVLVVGGSNNQTPRIAGCEIYDPAKGAWTSTADLPVGRDLHQATLLTDGRVLITGGYDQNDAIDRADVYDPATGAWTVAPPMATPRVFHSAVRLTDGNVLVTGGASTYAPNADFLGSAELFDPIANTWSATANLPTRRQHHAGELLPDGKVLIAGGRELQAGIVATAYVYDPVAGMWHAVAPLSAPREEHLMVRLPGRGVLVASGLAYPEPLTAVEIFAADTLTWIRVNTAMPHCQSSVTTLSDGKILFAGGQDGKGQVVATWEVFDPIK